MSSQLQILLLEDSEDIRLIMTTELEWLGYQVVVATDAEHALELAAARPPDLIISDIQMPGIDGLEFIQRIREIPTLATVPAIAVTGYSLETEVQRVLSHGFNAHLLKPVEREDLASLIQLLTERKRRTQAF